MSLEDLEEQAKSYTKAKTTRLLTTQADKTAFRFYFGQALSGMISKDTVGSKSTVLAEARDYALAAMELEKTIS